MTISKRALDKLKAAFSPDEKLVGPDDDLPVAIIYPDRVPVRGSVHLATGRVISRAEINERFSKTFSRRRK